MPAGLKGALYTPILSANTKSLINLKAKSKQNSGKDLEDRSRSSIVLDFCLELLETFQRSAIKIGVS